MTNREVAKVLENIADILQLTDENPFKALAYRKAARSIYHLDEDINKVNADNRLAGIPGIGKAVKHKIEELLAKGSLEYYDQLLMKVPPGVLDMLAIPGVGHKTVKLIHEELGVDTMEELYQAAQEHRIRALPGMGGKTEYNIKKGIELLKENNDKVTLGLALPIARDLTDFLMESPAVEKASIVGSVRRAKPLVGDIDILIATRDYLRVQERVKNYRGIKSITLADNENVKGYLDYNIEFEVIIVEPEDYYHSLVWTTGSKKHRARLFAGIDRTTLRGLSSEEEVYRKANMQYVPPELREDGDELEIALQGTLPTLIELSDIKGDLHTHTDWSDGGSKIEDMVEAARKRKYSYLAITDHSKSLPISGGLNEARLSAQGRIIDALNKKMNGFKILKGIEVDILKDGRLDFDDNVLQELDIVVASIHSNFKLDKEHQTERIIKAINNPHVDIIGHLTGRLLNRRSGYELDTDRILEAAASNRVALEINSHPDRLDIDEETARKAKACGIKIAVNSDAHHISELAVLGYGVFNARRGWLEASDIINTWEIAQLQQWLKS